MWNIRNIEFSRLERACVAVCGLVLALGLCGLSLAPGWGANGSIQGRVKGAEGGIEGAKVILWARESGGTDSGLKRVSVAETGPTGRFSFSDVPPGDYSIAAERDADAEHGPMATGGVTFHVDRADVEVFELQAK